MYFLTVIDAWFNQRFALIFTLASFYFLAVDILVGELNVALIVSELKKVYRFNKIERFVFVREQTLRTILIIRSCIFQCM